ncbi:hypothetical protein [Siphonobacter sp. SORGH_AS_1065]|uniref:hypothetical protein n=1 Tax=Siphonobacter sp. SORGH_AS_1065 TaxID=3041795 RepID=UPI00277D93A6|nr:hypothetical protein [Siphonobacter sp. SORGH_AS_1065]MDQ1090447.1 hypothetical protein [Siphonobacter sp. SORGH_AS_1065]
MGKPLMIVLTEDNTPIPQVALENPEEWESYTREDREDLVLRIHNLECGLESLEVKNGEWDSFVLNEDIILKGNKTHTKLLPDSEEFNAEWVGPMSKEK